MLDQPLSKRIKARSGPGGIFLMRAGLIENLRNFLYFYELCQTNFANFCYFPVDLHLNLQYKFRCKFQVCFRPLIIKFVHFMAKNLKGIISLSQTIEYLRNSTYLLFYFSKQQSEATSTNSQ